MKIVSLTPEEEQVIAKMRQAALRAKSGETSAEVVRAENTEVIHCRAREAFNDGSPSKDWSVGSPVTFMFMPAGVHHINAGFRKHGTISMAVNCNKKTVESVNQCLEVLRAEAADPDSIYGCTDHDEKAASVRVKSDCSVEWRDKGVYLKAYPTVLGVGNVNGELHRSWSPSFTTDADMKNADCSGCNSKYSACKCDEHPILSFSNGVRGSDSNPAEITGVDKCLGTLTNKPAFRRMDPVKAAEADAVLAAGTSEGAKKGWEQRKREGFVAVNPEEGQEHHFGEWDQRDIKINGEPLQRISESGSGNEHMRQYKNRMGQLHKAMKQEEFEVEFPHHIHGTKTERKDFGTMETHVPTGKIVRIKATAHKARGDIAGHISFTLKKIHQISDSSSNVFSTDATPSATVTAHCAATLLQDVPDATKAEIAWYEAHVDGGGSHSDGVINIRSKRQNGFISTTEKPTLDSIAAKHEKAMAAANSIAAEHGAAKLTAADVYERFNPVIKDETPEAILERIYARAGANR